MLLPLPPATVAALSLEYHLNIEALRCGYGTASHVGSLAQLLLVAYFLIEDGRGQGNADGFRELEDALVRCNQRGVDTGAYFVEDDTYVLLGELLTLHDRQLATTPLYALAAAKQRVDRVGTEPSPDRAVLRQAA
jgi:hypothetical protein